MISNMEKERKAGPMAHHTLVTIKMALSKVMVFSSGMMETLTTEISSKIIFMAKEPILGKMAESSKETGSIIKCMETVYSHGQTVDNTKVNT